MIRLFTALCKILSDSLTDTEIFQKATDSFHHYGKPCPRCGASGKLSPYGSYAGWLVSIDGASVNADRVRKLRFECSSCGTTHALLPDILIPHSQYSVRFKLTVLIAYFERKETVVTICEGFGIAVSTIYEWKKLFLTHKKLFLGIILGRKAPALAFLSGLTGRACLSDGLRGFFRRYGFSFLQNKPTAATQANPP
jgi:ribosomal protein S27AE